MIICGDGITATEDRALSYKKLPASLLGYFGNGILIWVKFVLSEKNYAIAW